MGLILELTPSLDTKNSTGLSFLERMSNNMATLNELYTENDVLKSILRRSYHFINHKSWCMYGDDSPDGDFCSCDLAQIRKTMLRAIDE